MTSNELFDIDLMGLHAAEAPIAISLPGAGKNTRDGIHSTDAAPSRHVNGEKTHYIGGRAYKGALRGTATQIAYESHRERGTTWPTEAYVITAVGGVQSSKEDKSENNITSEQYAMIENDNTVLSVFGGSAERFHHGKIKVFDLLPVEASSEPDVIAWSRHDPLDNPTLCSEGVVVKNANEAEIIRLTAIKNEMNQVRIKFEPIRKRTAKNADEINDLIKAARDLGATIPDTDDLKTIRTAINDAYKASTSAIINAGGNAVNTRQIGRISVIPQQEFSNVIKLRRINLTEFGFVLAVLRRWGVNGGRIGAELTGSAGGRLRSRFSVHQIIGDEIKVDTILHVREHQGFDVHGFPNPDVGLRIADSDSLCARALAAWEEAQKTGDITFSAREDILALLLPKKKAAPAEGASA